MSAPQCQGPGATHHHACACREAEFAALREARFAAQAEVAVLRAALATLAAETLPPEDRVALFGDDDGSVHVYGPASVSVSVARQTRAILANPNPAATRLTLEAALGRAFMGWSYGADRGVLEATKALVASDAALRDFDAAQAGEVGNG